MLRIAMQARLPERSGSTSPLACLPAHYITALPHASHPPPNPLLQTTVSPLSHLSTTSLHYNTKKVSRLRRLTDYTRPNRLPTDPVRRLRRRTATDHTTTLPCRGVVLRASPMPPGLSRAVLHPRCARARPAPSPAWLVMSSVLDDPTLPESSPLRGSPIPVLYGASGLCHAVPMQDRDVTPSPPAHPTRNGGLQCQRWLHAPNAPGWHCGCGAASFQPPSPAAVPGGPDTGHASRAVMSCASCPGALAPSMRHTHRVNPDRVRIGNAGLCAGSPRQVGVPRCRASGFVTANGEGSRSQRLSPAKARTK